MQRTARHTSSDDEPLEEDHDLEPKDMAMTDNSSLGYPAAHRNQQGTPRPKLAVAMYTTDQIPWAMAV